MVFLQVMKARAKMYESAVGEFFREAIRKRRRDQHARISAEEQLRYARSDGAGGHKLSFGPRPADRLTLCSIGSRLTPR